MGRTLVNIDETITPAVMNRQQTAAYIQCGASTVSELTARGQIPSIKIAGKRLYHKVAIDQWLESLGAAQVVA
jgi:excisionase family DNA binding protein